MSGVPVPPIALVAVAMALSGCGWGGEGGGQAVPADAGPMESRAFAATDFNNVTATTPDRVIIRHGDVFAISARGRRALLDRLDISTDGSTLEIKREGRMSDAEQNRLGTAVITITMPRLTGVTLAGSGSLAADQLVGRSTALILAGSGDMTVRNAMVTALSVTLAGSGDVSFGGRADRADVTVAGSGSVSGRNFGVRDAEVTIAGSGDVALSVSNRAAISIFGSGDVSITGGGTCTTNRRGGGQVTCSE